MKVRRRAEQRTRDIDHQSPMSVHEREIIVALGLMVTTAGALQLLTRRLNIPSVIVYMSAGLLLGPITGALDVSHSVEVISEVGILLLLFLVGLELSFEKVRDVGLHAVLAGGTQMGLTALACTGVARLFGFGLMEAAFLGVAIMFSSTVVVVKQLEKANEISSEDGRLAVGVLLVQDVVVMIVLAVMAGLDGTGDWSLSAVGSGLAQSLFGMACLLSVALAASRWVLPALFGWVATHQEATFLWSLSWCFLLVLVAELLHLSPEIGAFMAGTSLAQLPYARHFRRRIHPLMNFLVAVFFVTLSLRLELGQIASDGWLLLTMIGVMLATKIGILFAVLTSLGYERRTSFLTGLSLLQTSEFSLVLAAVGVSSGLVDSRTAALLGMMALVTMSLSTFLFSARERLLALLSLAQNGTASHGPVSSGHVIVVGSNPLSLALLNRLHQLNLSSVLVDRDPAKLETLSTTTLLGDAEDPSTLEHAGLDQALMLVTTLRISGTNELLAYQCKRAGVPCVVHAFDSSVVEPLKHLGVDYLLDSKKLTAHAMANQLQLELEKG
jgi:Kef-type K+ transport system membrane component KefB